MELFDYDAFGANDFLGRVRVPVAHLHDDEEEGEREDDLWLPLTGVLRAPVPALLSTRGPTLLFPGQRQKLTSRSPPAWPSRERAGRRVRQGRAAHQAPPRPGRARRRRRPAGAHAGAPLGSSVRRRRRRGCGRGRAGAAAHGSAGAGVRWAEVRGQARATRPIPLFFFPVPRTKPPCPAHEASPRPPRPRERARCAPTPVAGPCRRRRSRAGTARSSSASTSSGHRSAEGPALLPVAGPSCARNGGCAPERARAARAEHGAAAAVRRPPRRGRAALPRRRGLPVGHRRDPGARPRVRQARALLRARCCGAAGAVWWSNLRRWSNPGRTSGLTCTLAATRRRATRGVARCARATPLIARAMLTRPKEYPPRLRRWSKRRWSKR